MIGETSPLLFPPKFFSDSRLAAEVKLRDLGKDRIAFGVTKTGLNQGDSDVLKYIFYGIHNLDLELFLEIPSIENPGEILSTCFATGRLKKGDAHLNNPNIPRDFLELKNFLNKHSYNNKGFRSLASKFKECFDSGPRDQIKRFELLEQDVKERFVNSFLAKYKSSDEDNSFSYYFHDPGNKWDYVNIIYDKLKRSSDEANSLFSPSSNNS